MVSDRGVTLQEQTASAVGALTAQVTASGTQATTLIAPQAAARSLDILSLAPHGLVTATKVPANVATNVVELPAPAPVSAAVEHAA